MNNPLIWIIDEEWPDYELEKKLLHDKFPDCTIKFSNNDFAADLEEFGKKSDAIICQINIEMSHAVIEQLEKCKIIAVYGGGYDKVDVDSAKNKGILVTNVPGYCVEDIADYVLAAIYHFNKKLVYYSKRIEEGLWGAAAVPNPPSRIRNQKLLILGFGRIGRTVAELAQAVGMEVLAYDAYVDDKAMAKCRVKKVELDYGLQQADFVSVHAIYTKETEGLLSYNDFKKMKPTACLINAARGRLLVEPDLIRAAEEGLIAGAMLDVIYHEPPDSDDKILSCKNIVVTPHISYISVDSFNELKKRAAINAIKALMDEIPADIVPECAINNTGISL